MFGETRNIQVELRTADAANDGTPWPKSGPGLLQTHTQANLGQGELWIWGGATRACQSAPPGDSLVIATWDSEEILLRVTETRSGWRHASTTEVRGEVNMIPALGMDGDLNLPLAKGGRVVGMISLHVSKSLAGGRNDEDEFSEALIEQVSPIFHPEKDALSLRQARLPPGEVVSSQKLLQEHTQFATQHPLPAETVRAPTTRDEAKRQSADFFSDPQSRDRGNALNEFSHSHQFQPLMSPLPSLDQIGPIPHPDEPTNSQSHFGAGSAGTGWGPGGMLGGGSSTKAPTASSAPMSTGFAPQKAVGPAQGWGPGSMTGFERQPPSGPLAPTAPIAPTPGAWGPGSMLGGTQPSGHVEHVAPHAPMARQFRSSSASSTSPRASTASEPSKVDQTSIAPKASPVASPPASREVISSLIPPQPSAPGMLNSSVAVPSKASSGTSSLSQGDGPAEQKPIPTPSTGQAQTQAAPKETPDSSKPPRPFDPVFDSVDV